MRRTTFLSALGAILTLGEAPAPSPSPIDAGDAAPKCVQNPFLPYDKRLEFRDTALDGPDFDLARYRGYAVWINIFATWCGPCRLEQPLIVSTAAKYRDQGLRAIGLFANEPDDDVRDYRKKYGISYPLVRDANGILTKNLQGRATGSVFPAHLFIDGTGHLYCYEVGSLDADRVESIVAHLMSTTASPLPDEPDPLKTGATSPLAR